MTTINANTEGSSTRKSKRLMKTPKKSKTTPSKVKASGSGREKKTPRKLKQTLAATPKVASTPAPKEETTTVTPPSSASTKESSKQMQIMITPKKTKPLPSTSATPGSSRQQQMQSDDKIQKHLLSTPLIQIQPDQTHTKQPKPNRDTCFTPDGQYVLTLSSPGSIYLHVISVQGGVHCGTLTMPCPVYSMCFMDKYAHAHAHAHHLAEDAATAGAVTHVLVCTGQSRVMLWNYDLQCIMTGSKPKCSIRRINTRGLVLSHAVASSEHSTIYVVASYVKGKQSNGATVLCIPLSYGDFDAESISCDLEGATLNYKSVMRCDNEAPTSLRICNGQQLMVQYDHQLNFFSLGKDGKTSSLLDISSGRKITSATHDCTNLAIGYERGDIEYFMNYLENAKEKGRRNKKGFLKVDVKALLGSQLSWHSTGPTDLQFHGPTLLSIGQESVLVTWSASNDLATTTVRPIHTLPRLASSPLSTLDILCGHVCIASTDGDVIMTSLSSGDLMWTICGLPNDEIVRDVKVAENCPNGKSLLMYARKNNVYWLDVAKSVCMKKVGLTFNYVSPANGEKKQSPPSVTRFVESSDWLMLCAEQSDTPTSIHFYKSHGGGNSHTLHSIVPHPHGTHHKVTAMCTNSTGDKLCTVSATAGDIRVYVYGKDGKWRCKYKMQIPSACIRHTDGEQVDKKDFKITLAMSSESQDNILLVGLARSVQVWDYSEGTLLRRIPCAATVSVQLQTLHMLAVSDQTVELWDLCYGRTWGVDLEGSKSRFGSAMRVTHAVLLPDLETLCICVDHAGQDLSLISLVRVEDGANSKLVTEQIIKSKITGMSYCKQTEQILVVATTGNVYAFHQDGSDDVRGKKKKRLFSAQVDDNVIPTLPILDLPQPNGGAIEANRTSAYKLARVGVDGSGKKQVGIGVKSDDLPLLSRQYLRGFLSSHRIGVEEKR